MWRKRLKPRRILCRPKTFHPRGAPEFKKRLCHCILAQIQDSGWEANTLTCWSWGPTPTLVCVCVCVCVPCCCKKCCKKTWSQWTQGGPGKFFFKVMFVSKFKCKFGPHFRSESWFSGSIQPESFGSATQASVVDTSTCSCGLSSAISRPLGRE